MKPKLFLYLPVIHAGYIKLLESHPESEVFLLDESLISLIDEEFDYLRKEIRALTPNQALTTLKALFPERSINLFSTDDLLKIGQSQEKQKIILPKEDIFIWLSEKYLLNIEVEFDNSFLRWNRNNSTQKQKIEASTKISKEEFSKKMMALANNQKDLSSDWWRQVGAVLVKKAPNNVDNINAGEKINSDGKIIAIAHNKHLPSPYTPYIDSDPRNSFHKGENIDVSTAIHAEAALISQAAKDGVSLEGTELYVTTFPCPTCAKLVTCSGISKLYFTDGYSMLDGDKILKNSGVEVIRITE